MIKVDVQQIKQRFGIIGNNAELNRAIEVCPTGRSDRFVCADYR